MARAKPANADLRHFRQLEASGRSATLSWIGAPSVQRVVTGHRPDAEKIVGPIRRLLVDQIAVCLRWVARVPALEGRPHGTIDAGVRIGL